VLGAAGVSLLQYQSLSEWNAKNEWVVVCAGKHLCQCSYHIFSPTSTRDNNLQISVQCIEDNYDESIYKF